VATFIPLIFQRVTVKVQRNVNVNVFHRQSDDSRPSLVQTLSGKNLTITAGKDGKLKVDGVSISKVNELAANGE
jgi:hypothetical protein